MSDWLNIKVYSYRRKTEISCIILTITYPALHYLPLYVIDGLITINLKLEAAVIMKTKKSV